MAEMSWKDAIVQVLTGQAEPVHYTDIAEMIAQQGLKTDVGATPAASVNATISVSLTDEGDASPFERVGRGVYRLRQVAGTPSPIYQPTPMPSPASADEPEPGLINAFGMYWRRELVGWVSPKLLGQQQQGSTPVDFSGQRGVYLLHDRREVVYVGRVVDQDLGDRLKQHTVDRLNGRWDRFSWFGILAVKDDGTLADNPGMPIVAETLIETMEALLIEALEPPQNRKRGDGFSAVEFIQVPDPELLKKQQAQFLDELKKKL